MSETSKEVSKETAKNLSVSEQFTQKVISELTDMNSEIRVTNYQRYLIHGYFVGIDRALQEAEKRRNPQKNPVPYTWANVNTNKMAQDLVYYARAGLDMQQKNHLFPIPYLDSRNNRYDITFMEGYNGIRYIADKYALEKPLDVTIELVYSTDRFEIKKKSSNNKVENYVFEVTNPFDRGDIVGGFGYIEYSDPTKNKLVIMSKKDIEKRKPKYVSGNFWKTGEEGWYEEMCRKTVARTVYSEKYIPRDPAKIDENYQFLRSQELEIAKAEIHEEISQNANTIVLDAKDVISDIDTDDNNIEPDTPPVGEIPQQPEKKQPDDLGF